MRLDSILKKAAYQISNPTYLDKAEMAMVSDIEKLAQTTVSMKKVGSGIMDYLSNPAITAGIGGLAAGGGTYLASSKEEGENTKEFRKRRILDALTNGLAGAAVGGAVPFAGKAIKSISSPEKPSFLSRAGHGALGYGTSAAVGGGAGFGIESWLNRKDVADKAVDSVTKAKDKIKAPIEGVSTLQDLAKKIKGSVGNEVDDLVGAVKGLSTHTPIDPLLSSAAANAERSLAKVNNWRGMPLFQRILSSKGLKWGAGAALLLPLLAKKMDQIYSN